MHFENGSDLIFQFYKSAAILKARRHGAIIRGHVYIRRAYFELEYFQNFIKFESYKTTCPQKFKRMDYHLQNENQGLARGHVQTLSVVYLKQTDFIIEPNFENFSTR